MKSELRHPVVAALAPENGPPAARLGEALARELYSRSRMTGGFLFVILVLLGAALHPVLTSNALARGIFWALPVVAAIRLGASFWLERKRVPLSSGTRVRLYILLSGLIGVLFGALTLATYATLTPVQLALVAICHTGINAVALMSMAPSPKTYYAYMVPNLGTLAFVAFAAPKPGLGIVFGALCLFGLFGFSMLALQIGASLRRLVYLELTFREGTFRDGLTGLHNRRFIQEYVEAESARLLRRKSTDSRTRAGERSPGERLGLVMIDIDWFKRVNDTHGHETGDAVLKQFASVLRLTVRQSEIVARWGGEEFLVLVPDATADGVGQVADRIRTRIERTAFMTPAGRLLRSTCSIGYTTIAAPSGDVHPRNVLKSALALADAALYAAKDAGRNRSLGVFPTLGEGTVESCLDLVKLRGLGVAAAAGLLTIVEDAVEDTAKKAPSPPLVFPVGVPALAPTGVARAG